MIIFMFWVAAREQGWLLLTLRGNDLDVGFNPVRRPSAEVTNSPACARQAQDQSNSCRFRPEALAFAADMVDSFGQKPSADKSRSDTYT